MQIKARASTIKDWHDGERESSGTKPRRSGYSENAGWLQQSLSQFFFFHKNKKEKRPLLAVIHFLSMLVLKVETMIFISSFTESVNLQLTLSIISIL